MVKTDCFAFRNDGCEIDCKVLTSLVCRQGECGFYKSTKQRKQELMKIHGTTSLDEIGAAYAAGKVKEE